jgi:nucleotide-binding universal stress UspA family protein
MPDERIEGTPRAVLASRQLNKSDPQRLRWGWPATGVVVGVDCSLSILSAVGWAAAEAARRRRPLNLVHVLPSTTESSPAQTRIRYGHAGASLHWAREAVAAVAPGVPVTTATVNGTVGPALVSYAAHARLLVVGSQRPGDAIPQSPNRILGEVTAHAKCPAVVVPPKWTGSWASTPSTRPVLVGVDGSLAGERALAFATDAAMRLGVSLVPLTAGTDTAAALARAANGPRCKRGEELSRELIAQRLASYQERYPGLTIEPLIVVDNPVESLLEIGRRAQLIVVGSWGRVAEPRAGVGSMSQMLLRHSPCAVVVLSPFTPHPSTVCAAPPPEVTVKLRSGKDTVPVHTGSGHHPTGVACVRRHSAPAPDGR